MSRFEDQLSRMQSLMTYGMVNENENKSVSIEYHKIAGDGKSYGIFKECSKYYIKCAPGDKETLAEAYDYIGGWNNRKDYEYESYANALKQFDMKMMSINEACDKTTDATTLDPSKKQELVIEGTDQMKRELARQRQIMENCGNIGKDCQCDPERVAGNNDEDKPFTEKGEAKLDKDMPKANCAPQKEGEPFGDGKAPEKGKDVTENPLFNGKPVAAQHPTNGKVTYVTESAAAEPANAINGAEDWNKGFCGNGDAKSMKFVDGGEEIKEGEINDAKEWDEGLGETGTGEADDAHNNDPFNQKVNEEVGMPEALQSVEDKQEQPMCEGEEDDAEEVPEIEDREESEEPIDAEPVKDADVEGAPAAEEEPAEDGSEEEMGDEELGLEDDDADLEAEIEELRAEIEALKAQIEGDEEEPVEDEPIEDEPEQEYDLEMDDDPDAIDAGEGESLGDENIEDVDLGDDEEDMDECGLFEAKRAYMNSIVESVVKSLKEERTELHDFGKHPGYRKKPMVLPATGSDEENGMRDWNDDSVHSEAPFGQGKGDSKPFDQAVEAITNSIMESFKKKA